MKKVIVIGGGIAGLASAALLARDGYDVTLLESNPNVGGRAGSWEKDGFRFDTGPSWYLMPEVFEGFDRDWEKFWHIVCGLCKATVSDLIV
jgi:phytoene dehydrogenase-like protein